MGFKENLKAELAYKDILVKELAEKTGINKSTLDNYLRDKNSLPTAENAVKIAKVLGVSVEYLVTGEEKNIPQKENSILIHRITTELQKLSRYDLDSILILSKRMAEKNKIKAEF